MRKFGVVGFLIAFAISAMVYAAPAQAQASRTWVSGVGDDANPCSRTAPCKTFAGAISKTAAAGEINCLDPGAFGTVTITKSISIICEGVAAGVLGSGTNGIIVNAASTDKVLLQGLDIEGLGTGLNGVSIVGGGKTTIVRCSIRNFTQNGVSLAETSNARVVVQDTLITGNAVGGISVRGAAGANAVVDRTTLDKNGMASITVAGLGTLFISGSMLEGAPAAFAISGGGTVTSYGDNVVRGTGTPTTISPKM
jgi:hypothetical protein